MSEIQRYDFSSDGHYPSNSGGWVDADEAKFRLTIMIQYLQEEEKQFYLKMLHRYTNLLDFSQFCEQHNLGINHD